MPERQISPEKLREFRLNDFVKIVIRGARGLKEKSDVSGTNSVSVAEFNSTQERVRGEIEKAMEEGFALREIIEKLKPALDIAEFKLEPHEDQLNLTALLSSCSTVAEGGEEGERKEKINEVIVKDIKEAKNTSEPVRINFSMVPPDDKPGPQVDQEKSVDTGIEKRTLPRTEELISLLQNFDQMKEGDRYYRIQYEPNLAELDAKISGRMRKKEYEMFVIPELQVMILVCNEEGNSTFVIRRPCLSLVDLPHEMNGQKVEPPSGDNPLFYAGLKKSKLHSLERNEHNPNGVVISVEWDDTEWADKVLDAITMKFDNEQSLSFDEINSLVGANTETNKGRINEYLSCISDQELRYIDVNKHYRLFLEKNGLTIDDCPKITFAKNALIQLEVRLQFSPIKLAKEYLLEKSYKDLTELDPLILYRYFLQIYDIKEETWSYNSFGMLLRMVCEERGVIRKSEIDKSLKDRVRKFLEDLEPVELLALTYKQLYDKLVADKILREGELTIIQVKDVLKHFRHEKGVRKHVISNRELRQKVKVFFRISRDSKKSVRELYIGFLNENGLTEDDYSYRAFDAKFFRERKNNSVGGVEVEKRDDAKERPTPNELANNFISGLDPSWVASKERFLDLDAPKLHRDFLMLNGINSTDYPRLNFENKLRRMWQKLRNLN
ncbi:MAG: hypothetical protein WA057_06800 [Candidatus Magasanikiibacteriota bacterium]